MRFLVFHSGLSAGSGSCENTSSAGAGDLACLQRLDQRRLVDHAAARHIDQIGARLHGGEDFLADDAARLGRQRGERHQVVEFGRDLQQARRDATMRSKPGVWRGLPLMPITVMPKALQIGARYSAISPTPRMPTVLPASSADGQRSHSLVVLRAHRARHVAGERQHDRRWWLPIPARRGCRGYW